VKPTLQIAFITGRSQPDCWLLSPQQSAFLQKLNLMSAQPVKVNFPWQDLPACDYQGTGLLRASVNNAREYLRSRRPDFVRRYQPSALMLFERADRTLLLSGSCGLELFNNLHLPAEILSRISLFAWGPVARRRPACRHLLVQGQQDVISRLWFSQVDVRIDGGHMDYLTRPELPELCRQFMAEEEA
jgi:hypothetical protein